MTPEELQNQIEALSQKIQDLERNQIEVLSQKIQSLERNQIQVQLDPTIALYLSVFLNTKPTQTYSTSTPSGVAPTGSIWMQNLGSLVTNTIWIYSGGWVQIK